MAGAVRNFLSKYADALLEEIQRFRNSQQKSEEAEKLLEAIAEAWRTIPLEEKQIPYQDREREFWFGFHR